MLGEGQSSAPMKTVHISGQSRRSSRNGSDKVAWRCATASQTPKEFALSDPRDFHVPQSSYIHGLRCGSRHAQCCGSMGPLRTNSDLSRRALCPHRRAPSGHKRHAGHEQIQMIATAIGIPKPSAPKIARTNSESTLTWLRTPDDDMTLLLGAPRASARPQDEQSIAPLGQGP
jgi:hypothetical protein